MGILHLKVFLSSCRNPDPVRIPLSNQSICHSQNTLSSIIISALFVYLYYRIAKPSVASCQYALYHSDICLMPVVSDALSVELLLYMVIYYFGPARYSDGSYILAHWNGVNGFGTKNDVLIVIWHFPALFSFGTVS